MTRDRLVWLAEVPFEGRPHRQPQLAALLSRQFEVTFVEPAAPLRPPRLVPWVRDGLLVAQAAPLLNARPIPLRRLLTSQRTRSAAAWLGTRQVLYVTRAGPTDVVVCSNVYLSDAAVALRPDVFLLDICDDPRYYPGEPPWTHELLIRSVRRADLVTTSSRTLEAEFRALGHPNVHYLPNGIPQDQLIPSESRRESAAPKVAGFLGHLGPWVDFDLINFVAERLPRYTVTLVGPIDPACTAEVRWLVQRPNVRYMAPVPHAEVARVIAGFDVALIPFRVSPYTRAVNPVKLYEYAAQNVPIVSTAFSPDVDQFQEWVDVCQTSAEFARIVDERARGSGRRELRWIAEAHTWHAIADTLVELINSARRRPTVTSG